MAKQEHHKKEDSEHKVESENKTEHKHFAPKNNLWMYTTAALAVLLIIVIAFAFMPKSSGSQMTADQCAAKTVEFLNKNMVQAGTSASLKSVKEVGGIYEVTTDYQNSSVPVYMTKDCTIMFFNSVNTTQDLPTNQNDNTQQTAPTKTDRPSVEMYVMAFCPYGVQAEQAMESVVSTLGNKADFKVRFIASVNGNDTSSVQSLHGIEEAKEDLRQVCIMKYNPDKYWAYLSDINANCYSKYRDSVALDACWKNASTKLGISVTTIETCAYGSEGLNFLKADEALTNQKGISGSPTIIINGATYGGSRTPDAIKNTVCSAFTTAPSECSQNLSTTGSAASGGCG